MSDQLFPYILPQEDIQQRITQHVQTVQENNYVQIILLQKIQQNPWNRIHDDKRKHNNKWRENASFT